MLPDESTLHVTKVGSVHLETVVDGDVQEVTLRNVYYAPALSRDLRIISYGRLKRASCKLVDTNEVSGVIVKDDDVMFEFTLVNDVCMVAATPTKTIGLRKASLEEVMFAAVAASGDLTEPHKATFYQLHLRLGYLSYDTLERMARQANSGIELLDRDRPHCVTCSQGKGTCSDQPQKDSGDKAPIDRIGGVIVSDLKGPIAPKNKHGHKYMVTFIEYLSNYVRVFTASHKHKAAAMFLHFVAWFEAEFNCRIRVLRTDGGGEYDTQSVDLFCKSSGIRHQKTEAGTPQSNGKAKRMNRTIFNMVRCMLFGSGIPLTHWSDAAEYAAFILNPTPTRANKNRASPLEVLTGKASLEEDYTILLQIPPGMIIDAARLEELGVTSTDELALELEHSIYGLKQSGRLWNELLVTTLTKIGFVQCITDSCVFYKVDGRDMVLVGVYVDDIIATGKAPALVDQFFTDMKELQLKDLGVLSKFLGMRFQQCGDDSVKVDQEQTIIEMLEKHDLGNLNGVRAPTGSSEPATAEGDVPLPTKCTTIPRMPTVKKFQSLTGSLLWSARCTRPDISFAVHKVARRWHAPTTGDWKLAKRVARYLRGTRATAMHIKPDDEPAIPFRLTSFTDADFAGDVDNRKSISAGIQLINGMVAGWHCRKQTAVALSTAEAEFVSAATGGVEILGIKELLSEIGLMVKTPVVLRIDDVAAIQQITNEAASANAKRVDIKLKFLRDYSKKGKVKADFTETRAMVADLLTKALPAPRIQELCEAIGMVLSH